MSKILRLINDEKKNLIISAAKGCTADYDADNRTCKNTDLAICVTGADYCTFTDQVACSEGAVDECTTQDLSACTEKHYDSCRIDVSYCSEAEKYDFDSL